MDIEKLTDAIAAHFIPVEASGRHVHVTKEQAMTLFGQPLRPMKPLSQPGQFVAEQRVTVVGPKGSFSGVAVLGPERQAAQVEVSLTDARHLGISAPVRLSGDVEGSPGAVLVSDMGKVTLTSGVICAKRHIHFTPEDAKKYGIADGQEVKLQTFGDRGMIFSHTVARISPDFATAAHLDYDEANACGFQKGDLGRVLP